MRSVSHITLLLFLLNFSFSQAHVDSSLTDKDSNFYLARNDHFQNSFTYFFNDDKRFKLYVFDKNSIGIFDSITFKVVYINKVHPKAQKRIKKKRVRKSQSKVQPLIVPASKFATLFDFVIFSVNPSSKSDNDYIFSKLCFVLANTIQNKQKGIIYFLFPHVKAVFFEKYVKSIISISCEQSFFDFFCHIFQSRPPPIIRSL